MKREVNKTEVCPYCLEKIRSDAIKCKHCSAHIMREKPDHEGTCPQCREKIHPEAIRCKHCKSNLLQSVATISDMEFSAPKEVQRFSYNDYFSHVQETENDCEKKKKCCEDLLRCIRQKLDSGPVTNADIEKCLAEHRMCLYFKPPKCIWMYVYDPFRGWVLKCVDITGGIPIPR